MEYKKSYSSKKKDSRKYESKDLRKDGGSDSRNQESTDVRKYASQELRNQEPAEVRTFDGTLKPLMSEEEKKDAQVLELSYDFSCRIIRLYKYLNEGKLSKADRDIIDALGRQLVRSATSINANMNEAQHPQSDADFLSKASIALKEARESENWLSLLRDNGYLSTVQSESLLHDCSRINRILITITSKVRNRIQGTTDKRKKGTTDNNSENP